MDVPRLVPAQPPEDFTTVTRGKKLPCCATTKHQPVWMFNLHMVYISRQLDVSEYFADEELKHIKFIP